MSVSDVCVCVSAACAQVERWLEELHDRRRCLEVLFSNRRTILDQCRTLCQLYADLGGNQHCFGILRRSAHGIYNFELVNMFLSNEIISNNIV